jgi:hypothetical protein
VSEVTDFSWGVFTPEMRGRAKPASKSLKRPHGAGHTLAVSNTALSPDFNLQDRLTQILVINDRDIPELKAPCLVRSQSGIDGE